MAKRIIRPRSQNNKASDTKELVSQWRILRQIGVYPTKETPKASALTKSRRSAIKRHFVSLQSLGQYEQGEVYRPVHKHEYEKVYSKRDAMGRITKITRRKYSRYELDTEHFQVLKQKPQKVPGSALKTPTGFVAPKSPNEKLRVTKEGKVETTQVIGAAKTQFTREPLSGPVEFLTLIDDIKSGRLTFKNNEGLALWNNGVRTVTYGQSAIMVLVARLSRYAQGRLNRQRGGKGNFDDWSSNSEVAFVRRMK